MSYTPPSLSLCSPWMPRGWRRSLAHQLLNSGCLPVPAAFATHLMAAAPPSAEALEAGAAGLKKGTETKVGGGSADPAVLEHFKKIYSDNGGDKDAVCGALGLDAAEWVGIDSEAKFLAKFLG